MTARETVTCEECAGSGEGGPDGVGCHDCGSAGFIDKPVSVGERFPIEQARVRELLGEYRAIGSAGVFGAAMIEATLRKADEAMASGDVVQIVRAFQALLECE